ncbi:hypothetical protein EON83_03620 [bacterium]|nr:MAG: hypothetical protein EON83_03620 [bacterium]
MNISRFLLGALVVSALPVLAQPELRPTNGLPFPLISVEEAIRIVRSEKPIVLHLRDVSLQDAFIELEKQSGISLDRDLGATRYLGKKLSVDIETRSFEQAFQAVVEKAGIGAKLQRLRGGNALSVVFSAEAIPDDGTPRSGKAPFEVRVANINSSTAKSIIPGKNPLRNESSSLTLALAFETEPQIYLATTPRLRLTRAEDEEGRSLLLDQRQPSTNFNWDAGRATQTSVRLRTIEGGSKKLTHLEGVTVYVLPTRYEKWQVADVLTAKDATHDFQDLRLDLNAARQLGNRLQLDLEVTPPVGTGVMNNGRPNQTSFSTSQLLSFIKIKDATGQELIQSGYDSNENNGKIKVQMNFVVNPRTTRPVVIENGQPVRRPLTPTKITAPLSLSLNAPVDFVQTEVPFSFSDLPLP